MQMTLSESNRALLRTLVESEGAFRLEKLQEEDGYLVVTLGLTHPDGEVLLPAILDGFDIEAFSLKKGQVRLSAPAVEAAEALRLYAATSDPDWRAAFEQLLAAETGCPAKVVASNQFEVAFDLDMPRLATSVKVPDYVLVDEVDLQGGVLLCHSEAVMALSLMGEASLPAGMPFALPVSAPPKGKKKLLN